MNLGYPSDTSTFSHELRSFRLENSLSREEASKLLGISSSTLRRWEDTKASPQSATLWKILDHLNRQTRSRRWQHVEVERLSNIIENFARSLDLSPVESFRTKLTRIERTLSSSILKASQTDFQFDSDLKVLKPVPFTEDLDLFESARKQTVKQLLEDAMNAADEVAAKIDGANIEQRYLSDALRAYSTQCKRDTPNPRILERKGDLIRFVLNSEDISHTVNRFIIKELEQFVDIHNELMRGLFGSVLGEMRNLSGVAVKNAIVQVSPEALEAAKQDLQEHIRTTSAGGARVSQETFDILADVHKEVDDLVRSFQQTNDPATRALRLARVKTASIHGALFIGRLLYRAAGACLEFGANAATMATLVEVTAPGSIRKAYELIGAQIVDLPPLPNL